MLTIEEGKRATENNYCAYCGELLIYELNNRDMICARCGARFPEYPNKERVPTDELIEELSRRMDFSVKDICQKIIDDDWAIKEYLEDAGFVVVER